MPVAYALQNNTDALKLKSIELELETQPEKRQMRIEDVWTSKRQVRPGERLDIYTLLAGDKGTERTEKVTYEVPVGAAPGTLYVTVADGPATNVAEFRHFSLAEPRPATQLVSLLNSIRGNTAAYVRLWRANPAYTVQGEDLPQPPPSVGLILGRSGLAAGAAQRSSTVAELRFGVNGLAVSGSRTVQVEIKE
jgi:hypothetical protein